MSCLVVVGGVAFAVMYAIRSIPGSFNLRVSRDGELEGLDIHEHGTPAYHMEFGQGFSYTTPSGLGGTTRMPLDRTESSTESRV
jgi:hypothetical protein